MKYLLSFLTFLICNASQAAEVNPLPTFSPENLVQLLDEGNMKEANLIYEKSILKNINLLFLWHNLSHSRNGAKKIYEKDNLIILEGNPWIRSGDSLIETLDGKKSLIKIHKKTMRIVYVQGEFIQSHLLK